MGKQKQKAPKSSSVFKVKNQQIAKEKKKSKGAKTNIKKLKLLGRQSVEAADDVFNNLKAKLRQEKTAHKQNEKHKKPDKTKKEMTLGEAIDIDDAVQDFAKL